MFQFKRKHMQTVFGTYNVWLKIHNEKQNKTNNVCFKKTKYLLNNIDVTLKRNDDLFRKITLILKYKYVYDLSGRNQTSSKTKLLF